VTGGASRALAVIVTLGAGVVLAACNNSSGTLDVSLVTAPGSTLLGSAQTLDVYLTEPAQEQVVKRTSSGFSLEISVNADSNVSALIVDALDGSGDLIATGASPPFVLAATNGDLAIYMAPPNTVNPAPAMLDAARSGVAITALSYGAVFAGGVDGSGTAGTELAIYDAFDHTLTQGLAMPAARSQQIIADGSSDIVYLYGGKDGSGNPTSSFWSFDTSVSPNGAYDQFTSSTGLPSVGQIALNDTDADEYIVSGTPPISMLGDDGSASALAGVASLPDAGASVTTETGTIVAVFVGSGSVVTVAGGSAQSYAIAAAERASASVTALGTNGQVLVACGGSTTAVVITAATGSATSYPQVPTTARTGCAVAATAKNIVIAGGTDGSGNVITTADVFDATTLAPVASVPLVVPRTGATAIPLSNDQVLIAGGVDGSGAPSAVIELFTPAPLE
jgi:hypothetical protein